MLKISLTNRAKPGRIWRIRRYEGFQVDRHGMPGAGDEGKRDRTGRFEAKRPRLLVAGRGRRATGYGRLMHSVLDRLDALDPVDEKPDVVLMHAEEMLGNPDRDRLGIDLGAPVVVYCPVDRAVLPADLPHVLDGAARLITYTRFGA